MHLNELLPERRFQMKLYGTPEEARTRWLQSIAPPAGTAQGDQELFRGRVEGDRYLLELAHSDLLEASLPSGPVEARLVEGVDGTQLDISVRVRRSAMIAIGAVLACMVVIVVDIEARSFQWLGLLPLGLPLALYIRALDGLEKAIKPCKQLLLERVSGARFVQRF